MSNDPDNSRSTYKPSRAEKSRLRHERLVRLERIHKQAATSKRRAVSCQQSQARVLETCDEWDRNSIKPDEVFELLSTMEQHRRQADQAWRTFQDWLEGSPDLAKEWRSFTAAGGLTATEFMCFLDGRFRTKPTFRKKHLRLITTGRK